MYIVAWEGQLMTEKADEAKIREIIKIFDCRPWVRKDWSLVGDWCTKRGSLISVIPA